MKLNWGIIPFPFDDSAFYCWKKTRLKLSRAIIYIFIFIFVVHTFTCQNWNKQATMKIDRLVWNRKNASHDDKDICYLSFWMPFHFLFLVQCVNAKAMSWLSMVEYRDLCKLFFKLKIKKIDITLMPRVGCWLECRTKNNGDVLSVKNCKTSSQKSHGNHDYSSVCVKAQEPWILQFPSCNIWDILSLSIVCDS